VISQYLASLAGMFNPQDPARLMAAGAAPPMPPIQDAPGVSYESLLTPQQEGGGGIGGFLSRLRQKATTPDANGMNFVDRLGRFGREIQDIDDGGNRALAYEQMQQQRALMRQKTDKERAEAEQRALMMQEADRLGLEGREKLIFLADPEAWAKSRSTGLETRTVGRSVYNPDTEAFNTAPLVEKVDDRFGVANVTPDGGLDVRYSAPRAPTFEELSQDADRRRESLSPRERLVEAPPTPAPAAGGQPRGLRNNNPGNIEDGPFARSLPGYLGPEPGEGRFARFETMEHGESAADRLLASYGQRGFNTPAKIVGRWAPKRENGAATDNYAAYVAQRVGVGLNDPLNLSDPQVARRVRQAMREFENGERPQQGQPQAQSGARVLAEGGPAEQWRTLSEAEAKLRGLDPKRPWQISPDGKVDALGGTDRPYTDGERNGAMLTYRVFGANERMNDLARNGVFKPSTPTETLFNTDKNGVLRIMARSDNDRMFIQAAKEWLAPILRKDTGAAVTDTEMAQYMDMFIPRFEDGPDVLWQKAQARDDAMRALYGASRRAYDAEYGPPAKPQVLAPSRAKGAQDAPLELPPVQSRVKGKVYNIKGRNFRWTGSGWQAVK